jgi:Family of unknown function (DUF6090)
MAKLFNKIRQQLISEKPSANRTTNYLKYAIGEIVLVVIGILIALSINNWNESNKLAKKETTLLISLQKEIETNINILKTNIEYNDTIITTTTNFLIGAKTNSSTKSIANFTKTLSFGPSIIDAFILDDILESNSQSIITNSKFIELFRELKKTYNLIEKFEFYLDEFWNSKSAEFLIENELGNFYELDINNNEDKNTVLKLYSNKKFISIVSLKNLIHIGFRDTQQDALIKSKEALKILQNNILDK